jgi:hypothetical protein
MLAKLPPEVAIAVARPRRATNQRTTVALHGTQEQLIPNGATIAMPIATTTKLFAVAQSKYPDARRTAPDATTGRGPQRSVNQPVTADKALYSPM